MIRPLIATLAAFGAGALLGYVAHRPRATVLTRTEYRDREVVRYQDRAAEVRTVQVAGPVRTIVRRELVQVPGQPPRCEETITTERAPVTTTRAADTDTQVASAERTVTRVETRTVPAEAPRWQLELRGGMDVHAAPVASLSVARWWGAIGAGAWATGAPLRPAAAGVLVGVRW